MILSVLSSLRTNFDKRVNVVDTIKKTEKMVKTEKETVFLRV